jgi:S-ribosylhomocysteine lyase LuxS involved in autoinducer biosynthesis
VVWDVAGCSLVDKMPKFRGRFCLPFQDIINMEEICSLETLEHVYLRVQCHILEDHNVSFHPIKTAFLTKVNPGLK